MATADLLLDDDNPPRSTTGWDFLAIGGLGSIGAGVVHAAAIGVHNEHRQAVIMFTAVAVFQMAWGAWAQAPRGTRRLASVVGLLGNAGLLFGFIMAKTSGISFIDGMEASDPVEFADGLAAALAVTSVVFASLDLLRSSDAQILRRGWALGTGVAVVSLLTVPAMVAAANPAHHAAGAEVPVGSAPADHHGTADPTASTSAQDETTSPVAKPYDPAAPIDLSGTDGVTAEQQAAAENIVSASLVMLPRFADPAAAEASGFRSIRDGATGYEHYINSANMRDGRELDPSAPESLVYQPGTDGQKKLVAAMYMMEPGGTLETAPAFGGALTQWHVHENLCFTPEGAVGGLTRQDGSCRPPLVKTEPVPMIHVWITKHPCGPFAALDGVGAGQIRPGETRLCDAAHGGH